MKRILGAVALALVVVGCGSSNNETKDAAKTPTTLTARGTLTVGDIGDVNVCDGGDEGYADITSGTQVVIRDGSDKKVGIGELGLSHSKSKYWCRYRFSVTGIPAGKGIYSVEVSHRGQVSFKESQAGSLVLTLGDEYVAGLP